MSEDSANFKPTAHQWVGFWSMIVQQTQNAFNDKMAQFILIPLAWAVGASVESAAGLMISLPFVMFAPLAGWMSDRYSKRSVLLGSAVVQLLVLGWISAAVYSRNLHLALAGFFALAVQAAFFSPAKLGINKELLGSARLGFSSGIQQMTAMLAILAGQIVAAWWFDARNRAMGGTAESAWAAALGPLLLLTACSAPAVVLAWIIPRVPAQGGPPFSARLAFAHFISLAGLWRDAPLRRASFGVAFFWGFAAYLNLWSVKVAKVMAGGGDGSGTMSALFMTAASVGMALGFGAAAWLMRKRIELGWVPLAGIGMTVLSALFVAVPPGDAAQVLKALGGNPLLFPSAAPDSLLFLTMIGLLACVSAVFLAPLNAWMQDRYPADRRGEYQAAANLQNCLAGAVTVVVITLLEMAAPAVGMDPMRGLSLQMALVSLACLLATVLITRRLFADCARLLGTSLVRMCYRIRPTNSHRIPAKGGVLLLPNHVTFADAFFLTTACPRPVRFVMDEVFAGHPLIRAFTSVFGTVNIRRDQPMEAIREVIRALKNGEVVCLFPEGQLTRTGTLCPLQRGFELIARKAGHPIIPVWVDGSWGSVFSFERNRFFRKMPRRLDHGITVAFGKVMQPESASLEFVRERMLAASAEAVARRFRSARWGRRRPQAYNAAARAFLTLPDEQRRRIWVNGHQVGMINALPRGGAVHALAGDPAVENLLGITVAFPELFRGKLVVHDHFDGDHDASWVGGDTLREAIQHTQITSGRLVFYDFGTRATIPLERAGVCHCPCLAVDGVVVAMSMPDPPASGDAFAPQKGRKPHAFGKLLPGWRLLRDADGHCLAGGPAAPEGGCRLPTGCALDDEGFLLGPV